MSSTKKPRPKSEILDVFVDSEVTTFELPTSPCPKTDPPSPSAVAHGLNFSTSTLGRKVDIETNMVRGGTIYNPDVDPCQHPLLRRNWVRMDNSLFREEILKYSEFLREHAYDPIESILALGWKYKGIPPENAPDWTPEFQQALVDAIAKALVIDTAFICEFDNEIYKVFTHNDVYALYGNDNRQIAEVYLEYPQLPDMYYINSETSEKFARTLVPFLTQFSEDKERPARTGKGVVFDTSKRKCVIIQPISSIHTAFGEPYLVRQCQTALEKIYLRFYEMLFLHKGGVHRTVAFQDTMDKSTIKDKVILEAKRGMCSRGIVYSASSGPNKSIKDLVMISEQPIPNLDFATINTHISEDAMFTKQYIEGEAATGALGGSAPEVNQEEDTKKLSHYQRIMSKIIKDVNDVFFDLDPDLYEIEFNQPQLQSQMKVTSGGKPSATTLITPKQEEGSAEKLSKLNTSPEMKENALPPGYNGSPFLTYELNPDKLEWIFPPETDYAGQEMDAVSHSVSDEFVVFKGNLFAPGAYHYPESFGKKYDVFTPQDIETFSKREVRAAYLELDHSHNDVAVGLSEGIGHLETIGFDPASGKDVTMFYVRKEIADQLPDPNKIKVSPYFHVKDTPQGKRIFLKNGAITIKMRPRAELTGLETSAQRQ